MHKTLLLILSVAVLSGVGCRTTYYAVMEKVGVHKRDLLRSNVQKARDEQEEAKEEFSSALERLRSIYGDRDTDLEKTYDQLQDSYDSCKEKADTVSDRIDTMDDVADDLFDEWEVEIELITSKDLQERSREKMNETKDRYAGLAEDMEQAEKRMKVVLSKLRDQVLFLKHNLNAQALTSLEEEGDNIQNDISALIREMNQSITEADAFLEKL